MAAIPATLSSAGTVSPILNANSIPSITPQLVDPSHQPTATASQDSTKYSQGTAKNVPPTARPAQAPLLPAAPAVLMER